MDWKKIKYFLSFKTKFKNSKSWDFSQLWIRDLVKVLRPEGAEKLGLKCGNVAAITFNNQGMLLL